MHMSTMHRTDSKPASTSDSVGPLSGRSKPEESVREALTFFGRAKEHSSAGKQRSGPGNAEEQRHVKP